MERLQNRTFGRLTVVRYVRKDKHYNSYWLCVCKCGNEIICTAGRLRSGHTKSCGCYSRQRAKETCVERNKTHGLSKTRLYNIWCNILQRCNNPQNPDYVRWYGSRGITVCDEWRNDFQTFFNWAMNNGYADHLSIDRIDPDGNYEPENCRWATPKQQANNIRNKKKGAKTNVHM